MNKQNALQEMVLKVTKKFINIFITLFVFFFLIAILVVSLFYINETVTLEGVIEPSKYVVIRPEISGILKDVFINEGDYVNPGELLGIIDDEDMKANLLKIEKELEISKNNLTAAEQELKLLKLSNENSLREAEINLKQAQAELENQIKIQEASKTIYAQTAKELNLPSPKEEPYELRNKKMVYCTIN